MDHQGHGRSEGDRAHIQCFQHLVDDYMQFVHLVRPASTTSPPAFLLGHSMGGLVAINVARQSESKWRGMLVSAPALDVGPDVTPSVIKVSNFLSQYAPKLGVKPLDTATLCRDPAVVTAYHNDPLVFHGAVRARLASELLGAMNETSNAASHFRLPCLFMHGTKDKLVVPSGSHAFVKLAASSDKQLLVYEGLFHELLNEPEKKQVVADVVHWLKARL
eukprot:182122-Prymnesium_polylepis.1